MLAPVAPAALLSVLLTFPLAGCVGLAHVRDTVPPLDVTVRIEPRTHGPAEITIVEPEFYAESKAFLAVLNDSSYGAHESFAWRRLRAGADGTFHAAFPEWERYIGFILPFGPGEEITRRRVLFIRLDGGRTIFRVTIVEDVVAADEADIASAFSRMPEALAKRAGKLSQERWDQQQGFYDDVGWERAEAIHMLTVSRSEDRDDLEIEIRAPSDP